MSKIWLTNLKKINCYLFINLMLEFFFMFEQLSYILLFKLRLTTKQTKR